MKFMNFFDDLYYHHPQSVRFFTGCIDSLHKTLSGKWSANFRNLFNWIQFRTIEHKLTLFSFRCRLPSGYYPHWTQNFCVVPHWLISVRRLQVNIFFSFLELFLVQIHTHCMASLSYASLDYVIEAITSYVRPSIDWLWKVFDTQTEGTDFVNWTNTNRWVQQMSYVTVSIC